METILGFALFALIFLRPVIKSIFLYYFSFSGYGYFKLHGRDTNQIECYKVGQFYIHRINPATGLSMLSSHRDIQGNSYGRHG